MDIRAPNTTRVVRALFKVQDEDRLVEFFFPPLLLSLSLVHFFFLSSGKTRCTNTMLRKFCACFFHRVLLGPRNFANHFSRLLLRPPPPPFLVFCPVCSLARLSIPFSPPPPFVFLCEQTWRRDGKFPMKTENSWLCAIGFQR